MPLTASEYIPPTQVSIDGTPLQYGTDWSTLGAFDDLQVRAPVMFVGHGMVSTRFGRDDLKDADLKGRLVVCIQGRPATETDERWRQVDEDSKLIATLQARGAVGVISVANGLEPYSRAFVIEQTARRVVSARSTGMQRMPLLFLGTAATDRLFAASASR